MDRVMLSSIQRTVMQLVLKVLRAQVDLSFYPAPAAHLHMHVNIAKYVYISAAQFQHTIT